MNACHSYCGRMPSTSSSTANATTIDNGECGACPWGSRRDEDIVTSTCVPCTSPLPAYDYVYVAFMMLMPLVMQLLIIESNWRTRRRKDNRWMLLGVQHLSAIVECVASMVITVLLFEPVGQLDLVGCRSKHINDWYTMFHNPSIDYTTTMHCTSEAVYPLYSLPFVYYALCLLTLVVLRGAILCSANTERTGVTHAVYAVLYMYPLVVLLHACLSGYIYYAFPYVSVGVAIVGNVVAMTNLGAETAGGILKTLVSPSSFKVTLSLVGVWLIGAFAHVAVILHLDAWSTHTLVAGIGTLFLPSLFYLLTVTCTQPGKRRCEFEPQLRMMHSHWPHQQTHNVLDEILDQTGSSDESQRQRVQQLLRTSAALDSSSEVSGGVRRVTMEGDDGTPDKSTTQIDVPQPLVVMKPLVDSSIAIDGVQLPSFEIGDSLLQSLESTRHTVDEQLRVMQELRRSLEEQLDQLVPQAVKQVRPSTNPFSVRMRFRTEMERILEGYWNYISSLPRTATPPDENIRES